MSQKAKEYSSIKYILAIIDIVYLLAILFIFLVSGLSRLLADGLSQLVVKNYLVLPAYIFLAYLGYYILNFPLNFYQSFVLEHKFRLSNQKFKAWLFDQSKATLLSYAIAVILIGVFYQILKSYIHAWWIITSLFWIFFSLILAKLLPVLIIPLFFKYQKLSDENLSNRIMDLARKMGIKLLDCFQIDFSKKTLKANAAFVGLGSTKRVILADTLKDKYTYDEIELILAHEFAHYKLRHLLKLIFLNASVTILIFYLIFKSSGYILSAFSLSSLSDIASLPVILIYFILFTIFTQPLENYISRRLEKNADSLALKTTGKKEAFISLMEKLASQNLADRNPHPLIKFFFFNHPPIDERIAQAKHA